MATIQSDTIRRMPRPVDIDGMTTQALRDAFLVEDLFVPGALQLQFTDLDRLVVGGAVPLGSPLSLENHRETGRATFLERRELGAFNLGGPGTVTVDGQAYAVVPEGCIYVGMGAKEVTFASADPANPATFYLLSCPAHQGYPTVTATPDDANTLHLGSAEQANQRVLRQFIHENGIQSCQLVMGTTAMLPGNVWNTFPPHLHDRRTEVYLYWNLGENVLVHLMGEAANTRHLMVKNGDAVLSPSWSIHSGCGQSNYTFVWGMAGENQAFTDMDPVNPRDLR